MLLDELPIGRVPEATIEGLLALADCSHGKRGEFVNAALERASTVHDEAVRIALVSKIIPYKSGDEQTLLREQVFNQFAELDNSDQRYTLPHVALIMSDRALSSVLDDVVRNTPHDKIYALEPICPFLTESLMSYLISMIGEENAGGEKQIARHRLLERGHRDAVLQAAFQIALQIAHEDAGVDPGVTLQQAPEFFLPALGRFRRGRASGWLAGPTRGLLVALALPLFPPTVKPSNGDEDEQED